MIFDFLIKHYPEREITVKTNGQGDAFAEISSDSEEKVTVWYDSIDPVTYIVCFSFQHAHCFTEAQVFDEADAFLSGDKSAIEFFTGDRAVFGGDIESISPENFTTEYFEATPFAQIIFSRPLPENLHFKVRSTLKKYSFDGHFKKKDEKIIVVIDPIS